jgi:hypothetical protein
VDGLVELAGADVLGGGVLVPGELDVAGRMAVLRHRFAGGGGDDDDDSDDTRLEPKRGSQIWEGKQTRLLVGLGRVGSGRVGLVGTGQAATHTNTDKPVYRG